MNHPYRSLTAEYQRITRRRNLPWTGHPRLATITSSGNRTAHQICEEIVLAVRAYRDDQDLSDEAIRALAHVGRKEPDAFTVLLHALTPALDFRLWRPGTTNLFRADALADLAIVISEATRSGDIDTLPDLARRLTRRAHQRSHRRTLEERDRPADPDGLDTGPDRARPRHTTDDASDQVALRVDLQAFVASLKTDLTDPVWAAYQRHRLARAINADLRPSSGADRKTVARATKQVQRHVTTHLTFHA